MIYSAHWDHLGIGKPDDRGDTIYNGALDNATGIAQLIEQARAFAREPRTDRSIVFLAVTAEEKGLLGCEYYAQNPLFPSGKTAGVINTDGGRIFGRARNFTISGNAKLGLLDELVAEGKKQGRYYSPDPHPEAGHFYRSDHFSFAKVGVPAISFDAGNDLVNGGVARGEALGKEYVDEALSPAERRMAAELGLHRNGRGRPAAPQPRPRPRQFARSGRTGRPTASSARCATRPRLSAADRRLRGRASAARQSTEEERIASSIILGLEVIMSETLEPALPDHLDHRPSG